MLTHRATTILGDIPPDWTRELVKAFLLEHQGGDWGDDGGDAAVRVLRSTNFTDRGRLDFTDVAVRYFGKAKIEELSLKENDLLLERSGGSPTQPVGRVGFITENLDAYWFSNFVQLLRPDPAKIDPAYLGWLLLRLHESGIVERLQHQTTQMRNLDFRDYLRLYLPNPPSKSEQERIAAILQLASDALGAAESKLKTAYRLKTALMQQLFTCGIPGRHSRFKDTKIGKIPEEWGLVPLHKVATIVSGIALNTDREPRFHPRKYLTVVNVQRERLDLHEVRKMEIFPSEVPAALLAKDDLVLVEGHANPSEIGRAALITSEVEGFAYQNHLFRVRQFPDADVNTAFILGALNSERVRRHWVATCNTSSGLNTINRRGVRRLLIQRPERNEQDDIAALLSAANDGIDACKAEVRTVEALSRSLLQNLTTGQVRLRV